METSLKLLSNGELATKMYEETKRFGECCLWMAEAELKITNMITENNMVQAEISRYLDLKHGAEIEKFVALSNLKKIELEIDRRLTGDYCGAI